MVTLARFGLTIQDSCSAQLTTGGCFLSCSQKQIFLMSYCAVNIQGVLGEGTLVSSFGVLLVMVTRMDVLMCFQADILLEITRMHVSR